MITDWKYSIDAGSVGVVIASLAGWLPSIAALLSIVWMVIRIWETETVRSLVRREQKSHEASLVRQADRKAEADKKEQDND